MSGVKPIRGAAIEAGLESSLGIPVMPYEILVFVRFSHSHCPIWECDTVQAPTLQRGKQVKAQSLPKPPKVLRAGGTPKSTVRFFVG